MPAKTPRPSTMKPSVSIIVPTYNQRSAYLASALRSAENQTVPVEIILVDDGSDEPVRGTTVRHEKNRGIAAALNTGIRAMTGDWFCWLPSDDLFAHDKVERQHAALLQSGHKASYHRYYVSTREDGAPERISIEHYAESHKHQRQRLATGCVINGMTVMIHRSVFDEVGLFDESYKLAQDWEMWCRIVQKHEWFYLREPLGTRRKAGNLTEQVERDGELSRLMAEENARIKGQYGTWWA